MEELKQRMKKLIKFVNANGGLKAPDNISHTHMDKAKKIIYADPNIKYDRFGNYEIANIIIELFNEKYDELITELEKLELDTHLLKALPQVQKEGIGQYLLLEGLNIQEIALYIKKDPSVLGEMYNRFRESRIKYSTAEVIENFLLPISVCRICGFIRENDKKDMDKIGFVWPTLKKLNKNHKAILDEKLSPF